MTDELDKLEAAIASAINKGDLSLAAELREKWIDLWNATLERRDG
jgi:hypothetical protein